MYPELLHTKYFTIHTYGFLIVCGFLLCLWLIRRKSRRAGLDPDKFTDLAFWSLVMGLVGGRVLYIITLWHDFMKHPLEMFMFWKGGLVFFGGFIGGTITYVILAKKYKLPLLKSMDIAIPSVAIAHVFGRFGCFSAGCCFGKPIDPNNPLAVIFTNPHSIAPLNVPLHPTQLYDAFNAFLLFLVLQWLYKRKKFDGQLVAVYGMWYSVGRSIVEVFRGDTIRGFVIPGVLSTSQFIAVFIFSASAYAYYRWGHAKSEALEA